MKNDEGWWFHTVEGFGDWQTKWQTDICDCRVAFVTEKFAFSDSFARGILLHSSTLTKLENNVLQRCKVVYKESETEKCFNYFCFKQKGISVSKRRTWKLTLPDVKNIWLWNMF